MTIETMRRQMKREALQRKFDDLTQALQQTQSDAAFAAVLIEIDRTIDQLALCGDA